MTYTDETVHLLIERYDPAYGARPLQRLVADPLAMRILEDNLEYGARLHVAVRAGEIVIEVPDAPG